MDSNWGYLFDFKNDTYIALRPFSTIKLYYQDPNDNNDYLTIINSFGNFDGIDSTKGFSYIPLYIDPVYKERIGIPYIGFIDFEQCVEVINTILTMSGESIITLNGITEITEEEYYKID